MAGQRRKVPTDAFLAKNHPVNGTLAAAAPRFVVTELCGYLMRSDGSGGHVHPTARMPRTSFFVQDTLYLYEVVAVFENSISGRPTHQNLSYHRRRAEREARRRNDLWEGELASA